MRIAESLTLPDALEIARASDDLVVFAGAGVSMGAPSNLPGFAQLAREVAEPVVPWNERKYSERLDLYLGDAERKGAKVQERARSNLLGRAGRHTLLHEHLLGIFGVPERVRLITTNFDLHFTSAATVVFAGIGLPHYVGPALPPGRDFRGIVQLHGSLVHTQDSLVLTDRDFAAAYLADGWATRFLLGVFAQRTVVFTGYSLGDPVMQYLMRVVPRTRQSYALCYESESSLWEDQSVVPVPFHADAAGDKFADLNAGVQRWRWYAQASPSDHDAELRRLVGRGPPTSLQDADYVRARLSTELGRITFWNAATDVKWFEWAAAEGFLKCLTDPASMEPALVFWARWSLGNFCEGNNPALLAFLRRGPLVLHSSFAYEVVLHLSASKSLPPRAVLRQLVALVVNTPRPGTGAEHLGWLLERFVREGCTDEAFALLRAMTDVRLLPLERLHFVIEKEDEDTDKNLPSLSIRIGISAPPDDIVRLLETDTSSLGKLDAERLQSLGMQRLSEAYDLLDLARGAGKTLDWISYGRTSVGKSNQDSLAHAEDVLILLVRTAIDQWQATTPERLHEFGENHSREQRAAIRRLALYAFSRTPVSFADAILERAVDEGWARDLWSRPEFYLVLKAHYFVATEVTRERFVAALRDDSWWHDGFDEHAAHVRFSLSRLLSRLAPDSQVTQGFLAAETEAHPDWLESDPDGFLSRISVGWGGREPSPIESTQMAGWGPREAIDQIVAAQSKVSSEDEGYALVGALQEAVRANTKWGVDVFVEALKAEPAAERIMDATTWGLRDGSVDPVDQIRFLAAVNDSKCPPAVSNAIGSLIDKWAEELPKEPSGELLDALDHAADSIYERSRMEKPSIDDGGWVERAINHPAGHAAQVWWSVANARDRIDGQFILTLDDAERARWEHILSDSSAAGAFARSILGMASDRLSAGDYPWAERVLFPAFDPIIHPDTAPQLWDGRLSQGQWSWTTVNGLSPHMRGFLEESSSLVPERERELGDVIAMFVANPEKSLFDLAQLELFVQHASLKARVSFADHLPNHAAKLSPDERRSLWETALRPYWRDRQTNIPVEFHTEELSQMIGWVIAFPEVAADVLTELYASPGTPLTDAAAILWDLTQTNTWVDAHPEVATGLVEFLAKRGAINAWTADKTVEILERAFDLGVGRTKVLQATEAVIASTSSQKAIQLAERLKAL
jgi:SIR2-like protein/uncharacterized protein DUF4020